MKQKTRKKNEAKQEKKKQEHWHQQGGLDQPSGTIGDLTTEIKIPRNKFLGEIRYWCWLSKNKEGGQYTVTRRSLPIFNWQIILILESAEFYRK